MSYKIAVASADGININLTFGAASELLIYTVEADGTYELTEKRPLEDPSSRSACGNADTGCGSKATGGCAPSAGCSGGAVSGKAEQVSDCRCVLCRKIGFNIRKQLEKRAISSFDVSCQISDALKKIIPYFSRVDNHQSLRGIANELGNE